MEYLTRAQILEIARGHVEGGVFKGFPPRMQLAYRSSDGKFRGHADPKIGPIHTEEGDIVIRLGDVTGFGYVRERVLGKLRKLRHR